MTPIDHNYLKWVERKRDVQDTIAVPPLVKALAGLGTSSEQWAEYLLSRNYERMRRRVGAS